MSDEAFLNRFSFWQIFWRYGLLSLALVSAGIFIVYSVLPDVLGWLEDFENLPTQISLSSGDLYLLIWLFPTLYSPIAFFPQQWTSFQSSKRRLMGLVWLLVVAIVLNIYARIMFETHLQNFFLPRGYVQCETERMGHNLMMKIFEFSSDAALCQQGVR